MGFGNGEGKMINTSFWSGKKVFLTGHTGFKGTWLSLWLNSLGAKVSGYSLPPNTKPSLYELCKTDKIFEKSYIADIRDREAVTQAFNETNPEIVIHMAAQPLVRESYIFPAETYAINVMGTVNLFEAVRQCDSVVSVLNVTTDKCYDNKEWVWGYREEEPLGGYDPYSSSKACSELVTNAYRNSFFHMNKSGKVVSIASARAGNVIGGGDWAKDRLLPDCMQSLLVDKQINIRNPLSIRPWQHVLEPLSGYLTLSQKLFEEGSKYATAWNFGPHDADAKPVEWIVKSLCDKWGSDNGYRIDPTAHPHEAHYLKLDISKASMELNWTPRWSVNIALDKIVEWYHEYQNNGDMHEFSLQQIKEYQG
ncbi:CDP-glucose 4,6-dehydratase [Paenibacillus popilliae]|uniref:Nucleoside-diphosphate sugar epimerase n=1 Tax=Paenibacillus popilliae ATCC 14706 TaxID=1212764 RepID=M9LGC3_PAEPP|nr:CDP-glucose 4,6-dehydratase [Paenibacillus popilliae]GAC41570.1 nucleoside-diphosphate sugar epimerase [Paenibacillus popilliae ATCC 14706]